MIEEVLTQSVDQRLVLGRLGDCRQAFGIAVVDLVAARPNCGLRLLNFGDRCVRQAACGPKLELEVSAFPVGARLRLLVDQRNSLFQPAVDFVVR